MRGYLPVTAGPAESEITRHSLVHRNSSWEHVCQFRVLSRVYGQIIRELT